MLGFSVVGRWGGGVVCCFFCVGIMCVLWCVVVGGCGRRERVCGV